MSTAMRGRRSSPMSTAESDHVATIDRWTCQPYFVCFRVLALLFALPTLTLGLIGNAGAWVLLSAASIGGTLGVVGLLLARGSRRQLSGRRHAVSETLLLTGIVTAVSTGVFLLVTAGPIDESPAALFVPGALCVLGVLVLDGIGALQRLARLERLGTTARDDRPPDSLGMAWLALALLLVTAAVAVGGGLL